MKRVTIFQENCVPLTIDDNDIRNIEEYTKQLSAILDSNNISLLHTSEGSIAIRPNKISSIKVVECDSDLSESQEPVEEPEDIIKD